MVIVLGFAALLTVGLVTLWALDIRWQILMMWVFFVVVAGATVLVLGRAARQDRPTPSDRRRGPRAGSE